MQPETEIQTQPTQPFLNPSQGLELEETINQNEFADIKVRHVLIRKIYAVSILLLLIIVGMVLISMNFHYPKSFYENFYFIILALPFLAIFLISVLDCYFKNRTPINLLFLVLFHVCLGFLFSFLKNNHILILLILNVLIVILIVLIIFTLQTKIDFNGNRIYLFLFLLIFGSIGILTLTKQTDLLNSFIIALGIFIYTWLIVSSTKLVVSGNHSCKFKPNEVLVATACLYTDAIIPKRRTKC